ncbi:MAG: hypothetical protein WCK89_03975 [bacterium]
MKIVRNVYHGKKGVTECVLMRESYREGGKVKNRTIANLSHCKPAEIAVIELARRPGAGPGPTEPPGAVAGDRARRGPGLAPVGPCALARSHVALEVLGLHSAFDEDNLYANLAWLDDNQAAIEALIRGGVLQLDMFDEAQEAFKNMKNIDFLHWQPAYHWTDQKLRVHGLYCVLALLLATIARKIAIQAGMNLSLPALLEELTEIREVAVIYPPGTLAHPKDHITLSRMSPRQRKLAEILHVAQALHAG